MDEQTLRKIVKEVVEDALEPVKTDVRGLKENMNTLSEDVGTLKEELSTLNGSVLVIEQTITSYSDSYKMNKHNIERLDTRTANMEEKFDIAVPEELHIQHFSSK